jgi:phenylacetate-CoA ligase
MDNITGGAALETFRRAAQRVPAYRQILQEAGIDPQAIQNETDFPRLPILEKRDTFQRFTIEELCLDGQVGRLGSVLTSSGHSGIFAFGLTEAEAMAGTVQWIDDSLDALFQVRSKSALLINCLPMGVKVPTQACTLAETSVRPDMAVGLVKGFGRHFAQIILVGEAAFIKHLLELGVKAGVNWKSLLVHVIVGEEPLAENARKYLEHLLGTDSRQPGRGMVVSSMGVAEVGLNLFAEAPPPGQLTALRRALHEDAELRGKVFGPSSWVPSLFTYDPRRIFVEFDRSQRLLLTTLDPRLRIPLVRYATGDRGRVMHFSETTRGAIEAAGVSWELLSWLPIVAIEGRGDHALAGKLPVFPEAVKEGIYHQPSLVELITANFRVVSGPERVRVRLQLSPGVAPSAELEQRFESGIRLYVDAPFTVSCERYETFGSNMAVDYERKFQYLER